jgi:SAM-dependent methyltransferase
MMISAMDWQAQAAERYRTGDTEGAIHALKKAARLDPVNPDPLRFLADLAREAGDLAGAAVYLRQAASVLAANWIDLGERDEALIAAAQAWGLEDNATSRQLFAEALRGATRAAFHYRDLIAQALIEAWGPIDGLQGPACAVMLATWPETLNELAEDPLLAALLESGAIRDGEIERRLTALAKTPLPAQLQVRLAAQCHLNEYAWDVAIKPCVFAEDIAEIPVLTAIRPGVSETVRHQYEENPYPRWTRLPAYDAQPLEHSLRATVPHADIAPIPNAATPAILIAGCGTGQHALSVAVRYRDCRVLAVDLSVAALGYARRKAQEAGVSNITFAQADMLEIRGAFDVIEAAGSLQCMEDPLEGASALVGCLRPGGLLKLGLYSATARQSLRPAQLLAKDYPTTPEGIRAFRQHIIGAPADDPVRAALSWGDFYSASDCRDLLMHVKEHQHSIPQLANMFDALGLRFLGFAVAPETLNAYRRDYPDDPAAVDLVHWAAFEARRPMTFKRMYQAWLQKPS